MGRRLKFGEPTVKREFRLPESLDRRLTDAALARGDDISDVLREALLKEVGENAVNSERDALKDALAEVLHEAEERRREEAIVVEVSDEQREKLNALTKAMRLKKPEELVGGLVRTALKLPQSQVQEFLFGNFDRIVQARKAKATGAATSKAKAG